MRLSVTNLLLNIMVFDNSDYHLQKKDLKGADYRAPFV